jgi:hemoglobin/transferrin/lactoferrin receptor protein
MCRRIGRGLLAAAAILISSTGQGLTQEIVLDGVVVTSTKTSEAAVDALSASSAVSKQQIDEQFNPEKVSEVLRTIPGVTTQETARDTATAINIRGLQDFGRVNVMIDGARQNFQRSGHSANGVVYIEPEMIKNIDITRGPSATIYGSGAIGGVVNFETLDADDILRPGEYAAGQTRVGYGSNGSSKLASETAAVKVGNFDILGQVTGRWNDDFEDGDGEKVPGSNDETDSKLLKARWRPAAGHQITTSIIDYNSDFVDQVEQDGTLYDTAVENRQYTLGYTFASPTNPLIDFSAQVYYNETGLDQTRLSGGDNTFFSTTPGSTGTACTTADLVPFRPSPAPVFLPAGAPCFIHPDTFPVGAQRSFNVETEGADVFNTSRFAAAGVKVALTYGADGFRDTVHTADPTGSGDEFTPSGERQVYGGFVQSQLTFFNDMVDLIGALRYDSYELEGGTTDLSDDHVSPKVTLGVTPLPGITVYGTYAEGFRAPALSESLLSGFHPGFAHFQLLPNPELQPEVANNIEGGVNLKYNNLLKTGDAFRAKFSAFRNKVENYIDQVVTDPGEGYLLFVRPGCTGVNPSIGCIPVSFLPLFDNVSVQYQNVRDATIEGIEFEAYYDARAWFAQVGAHRIRGTNDDTGEGLYSIPADQITLTVGVRALQERLVAGVRTRIVGAQDRFVEDLDLAAYHHAQAYTLVDLFAQYEVTEQATVNVNIDNLFDETYRQHLDQYNSPGFSARVGLTMRLGAN